MTVSSTTTKKSANGDGSNDTFPYDFKIFDDDDITVVIRTDSTGAEATKTKTTHYTVTGVGSASGGNVVFTSGNIPVSGETVVLLRNTARTQLTDYVANDPFPAESHEDALDKLTLITQELEEEIGRSLKVSQTNIIATSEFTDDATARANKVLGFDGSGDLQVTAGKVDTITSSVSAVSAGGTPTASATYTASSGALALAFGLVTGNTGATGNTGPTGAAGSNAGLALTFSNSTSDADPGGGKLAFNNGTISSATVIFIDDNDDNGVDISTFVQSWDDVSNATARGIVLVTKEGTASTYAMFKITGSVTNASGYSKVTVTHVVSNGTFSNDDGITVQFSYSGADASATSLAGGFTASALCTITTADNTTQLILESTDADATEGPRLDLRRNSASPADDDVLGTIRYKGENDASEDIVYAEIEAQAKDVSDGTEDSELRFFVRRAGDLREAMMLGPTSVVFNEAGADVDVRFETTGESSAFSLDAGNDTAAMTVPLTITTADNSTQLTLKSTDADASAGPRFDLTRDSSSPADGDNLGRIRYMFDNDAAEQTEGVRLDAVLTDASDGTEDVSYVLSTRAGGSVGERIRIDSDGLKFNGDTAAANGLDDYEEGTWTPVGNAASGGNPTFTVSSAHYTRIGRNVHVTAILTDVNTTGTTSNQVFRIGGLPYTPDTADTFGSVVTSLIDMDNVNSSVVMADASENVLTFFNQRHNQGGATPQLGRTNIDHQHIIDDESDFYFSITYITNQ